MSTATGSARGGRYSARGARREKKSAAAWMQILFSLLLLLDLFLLYTIIMQLTHQQMAFEASKGMNLFLLALFAVGAVASIWAVIRTNAWKRLLCLLLIFLILYLTFSFSELPLVKKYRELWISTAMSTMRHQGLATYYLPASAVELITSREQAARDKQVGDNTIDNFTHDADDHSNWYKPGQQQSVITVPDKEFDTLSEAQQAFYRLFYELDIDSTEAWFKAHPDALKNGYEHVLVNETTLGGDGTTIRTKLGEKVLAIDADNQILIVEVDCDGSRGVMAIGKLPSRLGLYPSSNLPSWGQTAGGIAEDNGGILAMNGSGFYDPDGAGNGSTLTGWAKCSNGKTYGVHYGWGYKRLELHKNGWFYIEDAVYTSDEEITDAMEFTPGLIINGNKLDPGIWTSQNPRATIGQSERGEILMLCVEGRTLASPGCSVDVCADVLLTHDCITALNCDGGTTAIMWYRGEPIIRCSNSAIPEGRYLPNAWVYVGD